MFLFEVDPTSDLPLWVQLRNRIAYLINDGTLAPGDKLPTVRGLAFGDLHQLQHAEQGLPEPRVRRVFESTRVVACS